MKIEFAYSTIERFHKNAEEHLHKHYLLHSIRLSDDELVDTKHEKGALSEALRCMKLQIPARPITLFCEELNKNNDIGKYYRCRNCDELVVKSDNYCRKCGQAIDWSDEN